MRVNVRGGPLDGGLITLSIEGPWDAVGRHVDALGVVHLYDLDESKMALEYRPPILTTDDEE